ncbi:MAG: hypothetical protein IKX21_03585 [Deltaproteobacteria bacterium]|nr:hypothetical protein [Deltaproteobacteria bacterium]
MKKALLWMSMLLIAAPLWAAPPGPGPGGPPSAYGGAPGSHHSGPGPGYREGPGSHHRPGPAPSYRGGPNSPHRPGPPSSYRGGSSPHHRPGPPPGYRRGPSPNHRPGPPPGYQKGPGPHGYPHFPHARRNAIHDYYARDFYAGGRHCPPGLFRDGYRCVAPGPRRWAIGRPLPADVVVYEVPPAVVQELGPAPSDHSFVRVAEDILMIANGTGMVIDAIDNLSWEFGR